MYKVTRRSTLIPFLLILAVGVGLSIFVPTVFHDAKGEIPAFALFPGEIAIALILSVLLFENASPAELIKIAGFMLFIAFFDGALCNIIGSTTMWMPDATLQLNWVQLIAFNVTGMGGIMALYTTVSEQSSYGTAAAAARDSAVRESQKQETPAPKIDFSPQESAVQTQPEAQELISQLDHGRIDKLEQSISTTPEHVSLESLFAEESEAAGAKAPRQESMWATKEEAKQDALDKEEAAAEAKAEPVSFNLEPETVSAPPEPVAAPPEPVAAPEPEPVAAPPPTGGLLGDVSGDIEDIFGNLVGAEAQKDFSPAELAAQAALKAGPAEAPQALPQAEAESTPPPPEEAQSFGPKMTDAGSSAKAAVKEFGKLSAAAKPEQAAGTLKTIGQMLLDTAAVEKIIKKGEGVQEQGTKWRILTVDRGANLQALMDGIASYEGVESALLMGKDGLLLSNTESLSALKYVFGPLSLAMHSTTNLGTAKLQMGELRQAILKTGDKINIMIDVGSAILAVFGSWNPETLNGLMSHITKSVAGSDALEGETSDGVPDLFGAEEAVAEPAQAPAPAGGVVNVSDNEMSDLFDNLLSEDSADKKKEEAAQAAQASQAAKIGGVVNVSDSEMSDLFDNLLADDSADKKKEEEAAAAAAAAAAAPAGGLLNVSDKDVGDLFDNLLGGEEKKSMDFSPAEKPPEAPAAAPAPPAEAPAAPPVAAETKQPDKKKKDGKSPDTKEFGKLSVQSSAKDTGTEAGAMKAIGRQLIDVQAVENIIKAGEKREKIGSGLTTARVISAARGEGIKTLLNKIDTFEGVIGSLIVGHDGLVIASTLKSGIDKDMMGAMCTAIHSHLDVAVKKVERGKLQQSVFIGTGDKLTVMTTVAVGILAVFVDGAGVEKVDGLLGAIDSTVRG